MPLQSSPNANPEVQTAAIAPEGETSTPVVSNQASPAAPAAAPKTAPKAVTKAAPKAASKVATTAKKSVAKTPARPAETTGKAVPKAVKTVATKKVAAPKKAPAPKVATATATATAASDKKVSKEKKIKMVRDSISMPKTEYSALDSMKLRAGKLGHPVKKTELIRAGIKTLAALADAAFVEAVKSVPSLKTGRPSKAGK